MNRPRNSQSGFAMILVLGFIMVVTLFATAFLRATHSNLNEGRRVARDQVCVHLADAGVNQAIAMLRGNGTAYEGEKGTPLGDGAFDVAVEPLPQPRHYRIVSTGYLPDIDPVRPTRASVTVEARVMVDSGSARIQEWKVRP